MVNRAHPGPRHGFTLLEILVAVALLGLVMLLLVRGVDTVGTAVTRGRRQMELRRTLDAARRVMTQDLRLMLPHPRWPLVINDPAAAPPALVLGFLRGGVAEGGQTQTEWVQYWIEAHPEEPRLRQWVRYAGSADNREAVSVHWWEDVPAAALQREVLVDECIAVEIKLHHRGGEFSGLTTQRVEAVDVRLWITLLPAPPLPEPSANRLLRVADEDGSWNEFRVVPAMDAGPDWMEGP